MTPETPIKNEATYDATLAEIALLMDAEPDTYYLTVVFDSREAYHANAQSPDQHADYLKLRALLRADPDWHDGEIVHAMA